MVQGSFEGDVSAGGDWQDTANVLVYPGFDVEYADGDCAVANESGDLAIATLSAPVQSMYTPIPIGTMPERAGDYAAMVGFAPFVCDNLEFGTRRRALGVVSDFVASDDRTAGAEFTEIRPTDYTPLLPGAGDSGSPLLNEAPTETVVGISSHSACTEEGKPISAKYTNLTNYISWLRGVLPDNAFSDACGPGPDCGHHSAGQP